MRRSLNVVCPLGTLNVTSSKTEGTNTDGRNECKGTSTKAAEPFRFKIFEDDPGNATLVKHSLPEVPKRRNEKTKQKQNKKKKKKKKNKQKTKKKKKKTTKKKKKKKQLQAQADLPVKLTTV